MNGLVDRSGLSLNGVALAVYGHLYLDWQFLLPVWSAIRIAKSMRIPTDTSIANRTLSFIIWWPVHLLHASSLPCQRGGLTSRPLL